jgi:hypothetical protein
VEEEAQSLEEAKDQRPKSAEVQEQILNTEVKTEEKAPAEADFEEEVKLGEE